MVFTDYHEMGFLSCTCVYIPVVMTKGKPSLSSLSSSSTVTLDIFGIVGESSNSINLHLFNFFLGLQGDPPAREPACTQDVISVNTGAIWIAPSLTSQLKNGSAMA